MGIVPEDFHAVRTAPSFAEAEKRFAELKEKFKKAFNKMALKLHPDHTGNDPVKTERFKLLCKVKADFDKLSLESPQARPPQVPVVPYPTRPFQQVVVVQYYNSPGVPGAIRTQPSPAQRAYRTATMHPGTGGTFVPGVIIGRVR